MDLHNEVFKLSEEIERLKKEISEEQEVVRHKGENYITLKNDEQQIPYCSNCWGSDHKLIQLVNNKCFVCGKRWLEASNRI